MSKFQSNQFQVKPIIIVIICCCSGSVVVTPTGSDPPAPPPPPPVPTVSVSMVEVQDMDGPESSEEGLESQAKRIKLETAVVGH